MEGKYPELFRVFSTAIWVLNMVNIISIWSLLTICTLSLSLSHENKLFICIEFFFLNKPKQHVCNEHYYDNTVQISIFQYTLFKKSIQYNTLIVTENGQRLCGKNCNEFKRQKLVFFSIYVPVLSNKTDWLILKFFLQSKSLFNGICKQSLWDMN